MDQVFVGRQLELEALTRLLDRAVAGHGQLGFVIGEPGIGKTRLAEEVTTVAEARGIDAAWGRAWEGGGTPPFWPWRQALRRLLASPAVAARLPEGGLPEMLARLTADGPARADPHAAEASPFMLYEAVTEMLRSVTKEGPALLVLDDMHIADLSSVELLRFVARDLRGCALLIIVTARDLSIFASGEISTVLAKTARDALLVPLARLQRVDLVHWLESAAPALAGEVDDLLARSEGNPLFVRELVAVSGAHSAEAGRPALPIGIRGAIQEHLALLGDGTRTLLEIAAILGRESTRASLVAMVDGATDVAVSLDDALAKGIIVDGGSGTLWFSHVLVRDELYDAIPTSRRRELHRRAWRVVGDPASALHHALEGAHDDDAAALAETAILAVQEAIGRHAFDDAAKAGKRSLDRLVVARAPKLAAELHCAVAEALTFAGRQDDALAHCTQAAALAEETADHERLARAALIAAHEPGMFPRPEVTRLLRRARAILPPEDSPLRAVVTGRLARALLPPRPDELDEYLALRTESLAMARRVGSRHQVLDVLRWAAEGFQNLFPIPEQYSLNAETIALAEELGRVARIAPLLPWQVASCLQLGDFAGAARDAARAATLLSRLQLPHYQWRAALIRALVMIVEGRFTEADALQRRALEAATATGDRMARILFCLQRLVLHYARGDSDGLGEFEEMLFSAQAGLPLSELFMSLAHAIAGRQDDARACLARFDPAAAAGIPGAGTLGWACAEAELADLAPRFVPIVEREVANAPFTFGPAGLIVMGPSRLMLGKLYALSDRRSDADLAYREARAFAEKLGARPWIAQADLALAELHRTRDFASKARDAARALGMPRVVARAEAILGAGPDAPVVDRTAPVSLSLTREGPVWLLTAGTQRLILKEMRGLSYLDELLRRPHREVHVLELASHGEGEAGDAGPLLDGPAKAAYRERIASLREELAEATDHNDVGRTDRLRVELEAITAELLRAVGLNGRDRLAGSRAERARSSVQRRLRDAVRRVGEQDVALGRHLELSIKTGNFCMYAPTWPDERR